MGDRYLVQVPCGTTVVRTLTLPQLTASGSLASPGVSSPVQGLVRHRSLFPPFSGLRRRFPSTLPCILAWSPRRLFRFSKDRPSIGLVAARPVPLLGSGLPLLLSLRLAFAKGLAPSAFVVSLHLDGFLRSASCGFVAPRSRSWGSSRSSVPFPFHFRKKFFPFARDAPPFEVLPRSWSSLVSPRSSGTLPLLPFIAFRDSAPGFLATSRVCLHLSSLRNIGSARLPWVSSSFPP